MMLTFKKAGYTTKEIDKLSIVIRIALQQVKLGVCSDTSGYCPTCQYQHLCSDMHRLIDYLENIAFPCQFVEKPVNNVDNTLFDKNLSI